MSKPLPPAPENPEVADDEPSYADGDGLGERLKLLRRRWAEETHVKAFQILTNRVLEELVRVRPRTPHALAKIKGIGPITMEKYGAAILEAIGAAEAPDEAPLLPPPSPPQPVAHHAPATAPDDAYTPTEEWTWRLIDRGFSLAEAAAIRGLDPSAIIRHATWMARKGKPISPGAFLDPETAERWRSWRDQHGDGAPPDRDASLAHLWPLFLAVLKPDA